MINILYYAGFHKAQYIAYYSIHSLWSCMMKSTYCSEQRRPPHTIWWNQHIIVSRGDHHTLYDEIIVSRGNHHTLFHEILYSPTAQDMMEEHVVHSPFAQEHIGHFLSQPCFYSFQTWNSRKFLVSTSHAENSIILCLKVVELPLYAHPKKAYCVLEIMSPTLFSEAKDHIFPSVPQNIWS